MTPLTVQRHGECYKAGMIIFNSLIRPLASISLFFWLSGLLGSSMVLGTLLPAMDIYHTPWFTALLAGLAVNTVACVALRFRSVPWASLFSHAGLLFILAGGAISLVWGEGGALELHQGKPAHGQLVDGEGKPAGKLPFLVKLKKFTLETYGQPAHELRVSRADSSWTASLEVEPGKTYWLAEAGLGIKVLAFNPDFSIDLEARRVIQRSSNPNNPALRLSLKASPERELWVFEKFPGMHQEGQPIQVEYAYRRPAIKQYRSEVEITGPDGEAGPARQLWVNRPLRHGGYTLYQASYDPDDSTVSILQARRDPGVGLVYAGFAILLIGLAWNALRRMA